MTGGHDPQRSNKAIFRCDMPCFGKVIDALMWQAALPVSGFEVTNTPVNIPILVILFTGFPVRESLKASTHHSRSFFSKAEGLRGRLGLHWHLLETLLMGKRLDQKARISYTLYFAERNAEFKVSMHGMLWESRMNTHFQTKCSRKISI